MAEIRRILPGSDGDMFISDGGLETFMVFQQGWDLPGMAAFLLLESQEGRQALTEYYESYLSIARKYKTGFVLEAPTWRANPAWLERLDYPRQALEQINHKASELLHRIRENENNGTKILISGCIGPRDDGYFVGERMTAEEAGEFHAPQISALRDSQIDMVSAFTINYVEEAIGIVRAAESEGIPAVISFTLETNGTLPSGETLKDAVDEIDSATNMATAYFMINCSHPTHVRQGLTAGGVWLDRIRGLRANASVLSHEELEKAEELDEGDPVELGTEYVRVGETLTKLQVLGGCCGTDHRHVEEICKAYLCTRMKISD